MKKTLTAFCAATVAFLLALNAKAEYTDDCITFSSGDMFTLRINNLNKGWNGTLWTSTDKIQWVEWNGGAVTATQKDAVGPYSLHVRGNASNTKITGQYATPWSLTGSSGVACSGNIETLRGATGNAPSPTAMDNYCYASMFSGCNLLTTAPELPATTLSKSCYLNMFYSCPRLAVAPALPATTLADWCYGQMFYGCSSLMVAPALPATTMKLACYEAMFANCSALLEAPALPAMKLASNCYDGMFYHCTSLTSVPELPATELASYCYNGMFSYCYAVNVRTTAPGKSWKIPATSAATGWGTDMFTYTAGNLQGQPELNTTYYIVSVQEGYTDDCITFSSEGSFTLREASPGKKGWDGTMWTSTNKTDWRRWNGTTTVLAARESDKGKFRLYVRGDTDNTVIAAQGDQWVLDGTAGIACSGNIETLRGATGDNPSPTPMADSCYAFMFDGCTLLTNSPDLPAMTLTRSCYSYMFRNCTGLTAAPALPATTLTNFCYASMFNGCTSLTDVPSLPATTLAERCYYRMFYGCSALEVNTAAPGKEWALPNATTATDWGTDMFTETGGTLRGQPALNTTYYIASAPQPIEPGGEVVVPDGKAEAKATEINNNPTVKAQYLKAPEGVVTTADYLGCFDAVATSGSTVAFVLNENGTNEVAEATEAVKTATLDTVFSEELTMTIDKPLVGFYYSFKQGGDISVSDQADLNKLGGRDIISFELTKGSIQYFYQTLVTPQPIK